MRRLILLTILLLLTASQAAALDPVNVAVTSSNMYLTADGQESVSITVTVTDGTNKAISGAGVLLDVKSPWTLQATAGITDATGKFVTTFLPTRKSGSALITATVSVPGITTVPLVQTYTQEIVAGLPTSSSKIYSGTATVGDITEISVRVTDIYGNPVDSRKKKNEVTFTTTSSGDNAFLDSGKKIKGISVPLNESGIADADYLISTKPGNNYVSIDLPFPLPTALITIQGIANAKPSFIVQAVNPGGNPPTLNTDGTSRFLIDYRLYDQWGNPSISQDLSITVNTGENRVITSNKDGKVSISYGPKTAAGIYTLTAAALSNPAATATQTLQFLSFKPTDMLATASPQTMASLDVKPDMSAWVMAKVMDNLGNPVPGQTVYFSIQSVKTGSFNQTRGPSIKGDSKSTDTLGVEVQAVSDESGYAIATFTPGSFTTKNPGFSPLAEGIARVRARWASVTRELDLSYKNYPYLSVYTSVNPRTVETNSTVEVTIRVRGDGYALQPRPVDVYMVTDRSGSMIWDYPDRMILEMAGAKAFNDQFDYKQDRLGQFSFGTSGEAWARWNEDCGMDGDSSDDQSYASANYKSDGKTYSDMATLDLALSTTKNDITKAIDGLVPNGGTPMRYALYKAITDLKTNGKPDSVRALVLLSDGDYNWYGDPLARGSAGSTNPSDYRELTRSYYNFSGLATQNMAEYAKANNIRIYTIGYSADLSDGGRATLETLASATNGKYYYALTGTDLINFYVDIAGALKDTAGVNTNLAMDFTSVNVNSEPVVPASDAVQYVPIPGKSTLISGPNSYSATVNSTDDWNDDGRINIQMGTIKVNQEWVINFTLKMRKVGNIKILGSNSRVYFDDNAGFVPVPDTYVTSIPDVDTGIVVPKLDIKNLTRTNEDSDRNSANLQWEIEYNGNYTIREEISLAAYHSPAYRFRGATSTGKDAKSDTYIMDIRDLLPGVYTVRVTGYADDAASDFAETQITITEIAKTPEILIR